MGGVSNPADDCVLGGAAGLPPSLLLSSYSYLSQLDAPRPLTSVHHLLAAFEAGIIMVFLTNPLWLIKTRMQLQPSAPAPGQPKPTHEAYRGLWHAVKTITREEGPLGLYKGGSGQRLIAVPQQPLSLATTFPPTTSIQGCSPPSS